MTESQEKQEIVGIRIYRDGREEPLLVGEGSCIQVPEVYVPQEDELRESSPDDY